MEPAQPALELPVEKTWFELFREGNASEKLGTIILLICLAWFLSTRIYGCFRFRVPNPIRELAFLFGPPGMAVMILLLKAAGGTVGWIEGGIDSDFGIRYGLEYPIMLCVLALGGFMLSLVALMLPQKKPREVDPRPPQQVTAREAASGRLRGNEPIV